MNTHRAHEHWWQCFWPWRHAQPPQDTGWQRCVHQREVPEYKPEQEAWIDMRIRHIEDKAAQATQRHTGAMTPIPRTLQDTEGIRKLPPKTPRAGHDPRDWSEIDTVEKLPMNKLLEVLLPGNALPVRRITSEPPPLRHLDPAGNALETMRPRSRYVLDKPKFADLPTVPTHDKIVQEALDALPPLGPMYPAPSPVEPPAEWLNSPMPVPTLYGLPQESAFDELMRHDSSTLEVPAIMKIKHTKESE